MNDKIRADNLLGQLTSRVSERDVIKGINGKHYIFNGEAVVVFEKEDVLVALTETGRAIAFEWPNTRTTRLGIVGLVFYAEPNDDVIDIEQGLVEVMPTLKQDSLDTTITVGNSSDS